MRLHFRPFPGLTLFTVVSLIILIALGTWQYQRLQWKTALLAEVEQAVTAPPLRSLADVDLSLENGDPIDFRRISFAADILQGQTPYLVYSRQKRELMWRQYLAVNGQRSNKAVYAALNLVADTDRNNYKRNTQAQALEIAGYVRLWRAPERGTAKSTPELNRWFGFDPLRESAPWSRGQNDIFSINPIDTRYYIDVAEGDPSANNLPIKRPEIRNNHFDYMLTWYGLAVALFIIYLILHVQRGRLGFKEA